MKKMEFMIKHLNSPPKSDSKYILLLMFMMCPFVGYAAQVVTGTVHQNVLLPCNGSYRRAFRLDDLVVNWQRSENDHVVHSFFDGADQPGYQEKEFKGRTQLFPEEFQKGNASLLLKYLRASDAGWYTCHYILDDDQIFADHQVKLQVQKDEMYNSNNGNKNLLCLLILTGLLPLIMCAVFIAIRKKQKRSKSEDEEHLIQKSHLNELVDTYREKIHSTKVQCCKSRNEGEKETDDCLPRCLRANIGKMWRKGALGSFAEKEHTVGSEDIFTVRALTLNSRRMLILGEAGIGKSCFSKGLQKHWASGAKDIIYKCIIYIPFSELNSIKEEISVKKLLGSKCPELSEVLTDLLDKEKVLIILDGLDEFNHELKDSRPSSSCDLDISLDISTLVSYIISKQLLPKTDVLVTSRVRSASQIADYFSIVFILEAFTEIQVMEYCRKFMQDDGSSKYLSDFITTPHLSSLASIPLLSSALCEICRNGSNSLYDALLTTWSRTMFYLLMSSFSSKSLKGAEHEMSIKMQKSEDFRLPENLQNDIHQLCKISYKALIFGEQRIKKSDFVNDCLCSKQLFENLSEFFFIGDKDDEKFEYRHSSIQAMLAALYCVQEIQGEEELELCLDAWVFGKISKNIKTPLLTEITSEHSERFQTFNRFFFGLLPYGKHSLQFEPPPLTEPRKDSLRKWFQTCIKKENIRGIHLLNFIHCVFELHDEDLSADVSQNFRNIDLLNIPLNSLDIHALKYCFQNSRPDVVDLRLCALTDSSLEQVQDIVKKCKEAKLSSNNLTEKSGRILGRLLELEDCAIEELSLGINGLGNAGTEDLFRGLERNRRLRIIFLTDNNIDDLGIERIAQSIMLNTTLKELHLCMNMFEEKGMKTIRKIQQNRPELKIVVRIAEDEDVLLYVEEKVGRLISKGWDQYEMEWLQQVLNKLLKDLKADAKKKGICSGQSEGIEREYRKGTRGN